MAFYSLKWYLVATIIGIILYHVRKYNKGNLCTLDNRIDGSHVLITGADDDLGYETTKELVKRGGIIHMICMNQLKCAETRQKIISETGITSKDQLFIYNLNLSSLKSILKFTDLFVSTVDKLDILINNAGIMTCPYQETEDGFELQVGTNYLGHFLLTNKLLPLLKKSKNSPRVIVVTSEVHKFTSLNRTDINLRGDDYGPIAAYGQSKLANILHAQYLARLLRPNHIAVVSVDPGTINTGIWQFLPTYLRSLTNVLEYLLIKTPFEGAQTQICAAIDPELIWKTGKYFYDRAVYGSNHPDTNNEQIEKWLWKHSESLINEKLRKFK